MQHKPYPIAFSHDHTEQTDILKSYRPIICQNILIGLFLLTKSSSPCITPDIRPCCSFLVLAHKFIHSVLDCFLAFLFVYF